MDNLKTGAFIKSCRKEKKMTQKELADRLHVTDRAVSKWERGLSAPDIALLEPLASVLGVTIVELLSGGENGSESADGGAGCGSQNGSGLFGAPTGKDGKGIGEESCFVDYLCLFLVGACRSHLE